MGPTFPLSPHHVTDNSVLSGRNTALDLSTAGILVVMGCYPWHTQMVTRDQSIELYPQEAAGVGAMRDRQSWIEFQLSHLLVV